MQPGCTWYLVAIVLTEPVNSMQAVKMTILTVLPMLYFLGVTVREQPYCTKVLGGKGAATVLR